MWVRDALPKAFPNTRVLLFGYDTALPNSNSFQNIHDIASSFIENLKASVLRPPAMRPLFVLAHSLGGIVFIDALVTLRIQDDEMRRKIIGAVLFGVPSRGMETEALAAIVNGQPNQVLVNDLSVNSEYLRRLQDRFSMISNDIKGIWAYETRTAPTVAVS
ncbi:hypothetical protein CMQ_6949 [Grosmannia clavigera kw1407]|uniref:Uncharacterized protein n=1 Tax=Grosmannia clavigera (strain kw1407 / UAMH 11150) TaxID=655863 RepID=F0X750_GROCL|nr:uncharacterized protein CMQ_6949 [Grosmannia clavigera kw1407]EFX06628.1 hypothetical protein CMQ_6949 [Grosmannia clavigera kw1407]